MDVRELMKGAIDIHVHIPPDSNFRRRLNATGVWLGYLIPELLIPFIMAGAHYASA